MINALSIDLEDYFQVESLSDTIKPEEWGNYQGRLRDSTARILLALERQATQATFFVLGWVAEHDPELIREIHAQGHEIACHGYRHKMITKMKPEEFRADLYKSKTLIEPIIKRKMLGYRAPTFSVVQDTLWALDILLEEGFIYDSSIFPIYHDRYGIPNAERFPHQIERKAGRIHEFPMSTVRAGGYNMPLGGGGYLRIFPYWYTKWAINSLNRNSLPVMVYLHPWEIDPGQPRYQVPPLTYFRQYYNLDHMEARFNRLLRDFRFAPIAKVLGVE